MDEEVVDAVHTLMTRVSPRLARLEAHVLRGMKVQLTHRQYRILAQVTNGRDSASKIREVASGTTLATLSESVDTLCRRGLLERALDSSDRRRSVVKLTEEGRAALKAAEDAVTAAVGQLVQGMGLSTEEMSGFLDAIHRLDQAVRDSLVEQTPVEGTVSRDDSKVARG